MRLSGFHKRVRWALAALAVGCATPTQPAPDAWELPAWPSSDLAPDVSLPPPGALTLDVSDLSPGLQGTWTAGGLFVGEKVTFLVSSSGLGQGPCHPQGAPCVDLRAPVRVLGVAFADASGNATLTARVPAAAPLGLRPAFQAVTVRNDGATSNAKSPPVARRLEDACASFTCSPGACGAAVGGAPTCFCPPGYTAQGTSCVMDDSGADTDLGATGDASPENPFQVNPNYEAAAGQGGGTAARSPYGTNLGSYQGVVSYSNAVLTCPNQPSCLFGVGDARTIGTYGYEYQCVEYVVRFFATVHGYSNLNGNGDAATWWNAPRLPAGQALERYANGGTVAPQPGDAIVFGGGTYGHIAVIRAVDATSVHIIHQNWLHSAADADLPLPLTRNGASWTVSPPSSGYTTLGWLRAPGTTVPPAPTCGDGTVNQPSEQCDGSSYAEAYNSCADRSFNQGTVTCSSGCLTDFSACTNAPTCGDGVVNQPAEQCDGTSFASAYNACSDFGLSLGQVTCGGGCLTDISGCSNPPTEVCNNVDDDGDGSVDESPANCFTAIYRWRESGSGALAWGTSDTTRPSIVQAGSWSLNREEFIIANARHTSNMSALYLCGTGLDHLLTTNTGPAVQAGYNCSTLLGYVWPVSGAPAGTAFGPASNCWRFGGLNAGGGVFHLFSDGGDSLLNLSCEGVQFGVLSNGQSRTWSNNPGGPSCP